MTYTPTSQTLKIKVGGVDITSYVPRVDSQDRNIPGISIENIIGKVIDTCTFGIEDGGTLSIEGWDEVIITDPTETTRYFAGYVTLITDYQIGPELDFVVECQDYTAILDKVRINYEWTTETVDTTVLSDIRTNATPDLTDFDFSTRVISAGSIVDKFRLSRKSAREALDELAKRVGADWYIDYSKNLVWSKGGLQTSPYNLSDNPDFSTTFPYQQLERVRDGFDIVNRITVIGADYQSDEVTHEYPGDGQQVRFVVPYFYHPTTAGGSISIDINTGDDTTPIWTSKTVGIKYIDDDATPAKDVLFAFREKYFEFATAPPNLKRAWRITGRYEIPLRARVREDISYSNYGRWFEEIVNDQNIKSKKEAKQRGKAELASRALARTVYTLITNEPGLCAGQVIKLTNAVRSIDTEYIIQQVTTTWLGGETAQFEVSLGDYIPDLYALMLEIASRSVSGVEWRDDEVLDEILEAKESLALEETVTAVSTSSGPYTWAPGSNDWNWGFGVWN